jgi:uncharacterized protein (DUF169 family)
MGSVDAEFGEFFTSRWRKYFAGAELPICAFYAHGVREEDLRASISEQRCLIGNLNRVREGFPFVFTAETPGCSGGKRYSGFSRTLRPKFEYFLSCGIPGEVEGERYKKSPELVKAYLESHPPFRAPGKHLVFKRWDKVAAEEQPQIVIFTAAPDVLAGLYTLANYDRPDPHGVVAPMGSGCASILQYPLEEAGSAHPRCVLGMFDVSARPHVPANTLTFAVPVRRFEQMASNMDESFLITASWQAVRSRLGQS